MIGRSRCTETCCAHTVAVCVQYLQPSLHMIRKGWTGPLQPSQFLGLKLEKMCLRVEMSPPQTPPTQGLIKHIQVLDSPLPLLLIQFSYCWSIKRDIFTVSVTHQGINFSFHLLLIFVVHSEGSRCCWRRQFGKLGKGRMGVFPAQFCVIQSWGKSRSFHSTLLDWNASWLHNAKAEREDEWQEAAQTAVMQRGKQQITLVSSNRSILNQTASRSVFLWRFSLILFKWSGAEWQHKCRAFCAHRCAITGLWWWKYLSVFRDIQFQCRKRLFTFAFEM